MKRLKKLISIFFAIVILVSFSVFLTACESCSETSFDTSIIAADNNQEEPDERNIEQDEEESEENNFNEDKSDGKIYIDSLSVENVIYLYNNGVGIEFVVNFTPKNTTENIYIEIVDKNIVNFARDIDVEQQSKLVDFTTEGNRLYPISAGRTILTISALKNATESITATCLIIVEEYEQDLLKIFDSDKNEISNLKSGKKAGGIYEIYSAELISLRNLENKTINITNSHNLVIIEGSKSYFSTDNRFFYSFDFYLTHAGVHDLQLTIEENYKNLNRTCQQVLINSVDFVSGIQTIISRENHESPLIEDDSYILYSCDENKENADLNGYFNNYLIRIFDLSNNSFDNFLIEISDNSVLEIENMKIFAKNIGQSIITVKALDGSEQIISIKFKVKEIVPTQLKIGDLDLLSDFTQEDLKNEIGNIVIYEPNGFGKASTAKLIIKTASLYVKDSYAYFEVIDTGLNLSVNKFNQDDIMVKEFIFQSETSGKFTVNLGVNGNIIYSFEIQILSSGNNFAFYTEDLDSNVNYDFENKIITIYDINSFKGDLIFFCKTINLNNEIVSQNLKLVYDKNYCYTEMVSLDCIFLLIKKRETFTFTVNETNYNLSVTFTIKINQE